MTNPEYRYQALLGKLRERGSRITSNRLALLRLLAESEDHPNALQLYEKLRIQFPTCSLGTVYKTLAMLKEAGEVLEIDLHSESHYDGNKPYPHPHLICNRCGRIMDGDDMHIAENINLEIKEKYKFQVVQSQLVFYGVCRECQKE